MPERDRAAPMAPEQRRLTRFALRGREQRPLEDRLAVRFPSLSRRLSALITPATLRLPVHWRLRWLLIDWYSWRSANAFWRHDVEVLRVLWHPDLILDYTRFSGWVAKEVYRGYEGLEELVAEWGENWQEGGFPEEASIEEFGREVFLMSYHMRGIGRASGARVEQDWFQLVALRDGLVGQCENFNERALAVEAAKARAQ